MRTGTLSVKPCTKESKERNGKLCTITAEALGAMKAARDRDEEFHDPARKEDILGRTKTRLVLWEEHLTDPVSALEKAFECMEAAWFHRLSASLVRKCCKRCGKDPPGRGLAVSGPKGCYGFGHSSQRLECSREVRAARRALFSSSSRRSPSLSKRQWNSGPLFLRRHCAPDGSRERLGVKS